MNLVLTPAQASELESLIAAGLRELSHEIADTDNAAFRRELTTRRQLLVEVSASLLTLLQGVGLGASGPEREAVHPGG